MPKPTSPAGRLQERFGNQKRLFTADLLADAFHLVFTRGFRTIERFLPQKPIDGLPRILEICRRIGRKMRSNADLPTRTSILVPRSSNYFIFVHGRVQRGWEIYERRIHTVSPSVRRSSRRIRDLRQFNPRFKSVLLRRDVWPRCQEHYLHSTQIHRPGW